MSGDVHVQFCERPGVRFPRATHLAVLGRAPAAVIAGRGRNPAGASEAADERREDPLLPVAGGGDDVPRLPDWAQLPAGHGARLYRHAAESVETSRASAVA